MRFFLFTMICFNGLVSECFAQSGTAGEAELISKADSLYYKKEYKNAALQYNLAFKLKGRNNDLFDFYKSASANAHANKVSQSINYLNLLVSSTRAENFNFLLTDSNFFNLHKNKRWQDLTYLIKAYREDSDHIYWKVIKSELLEMDVQSSLQKRKSDSLNTIYGHNSKKAIEEGNIANAKDSINFLKIKSIINVYGYMGPGIIGYEANQAMFSIILNRDFYIEKTYIPIIWQAFLKGNATAANYAAIVDKVALKESHAQIYGSIAIRKGSSYYFPPILDTANVDSIRKKIGLQPLKDYLKQFGNATAINP